jgi:hypothetical protein
VEHVGFAAKEPRREVFVVEFKGFGGFAPSSRSQSCSDPFEQLGFLAETQTRFFSGFTLQGRRWGRSLRWREDGEGGRRRGLFFLGSPPKQSLFR